MSSFLQTAYQNSLREIKRLAETEEFSPETLLYMIDTEAHKALTAGGLLGSR
jgi:hypothetical protein